LCEAGEVIRGNSPVLENCTYSFQSDKLVTEKWFLDSQLVYESDTYTIEPTWNHFWSMEEVGYRAVTCVVTAENGISSQMEWILYIGTKFVVPNGTSEVNTTTLSVVTAPGETFNVNTTVSPGVMRGTFVLHEVTATATQLLQPTEEGYYKYNFTFVNNTTAMFTLIASEKNGTFLIGVHNSAIAEDGERNPILLNRASSEVRVSPRYDINADFVVNIIDLVILRQHYGESTTEPHPRYDMNKDGIVNIIDLVTLKQRFGEQIPTV
ncbi:MAG: dockerin type I domain-containing protein, partial [Bacteroidota bacterium]|nr:dockerin type I domain-containing protein [Bacteroidota bacterium]